MTILNDLIATGHLERIPAPADIAGLQRHGLSQLFGGMDDDTYQDFLAEFARDPIPEMCQIVLCGEADQNVLDGWHRTQAALLCGRTDVLSFYRYVGPDPANFATSMNNRRRQLEPGVRALIMAKLRADRKEGALVDDGPRTAQEAADLGKVSQRHVQRADRVLKAGLMQCVIDQNATLEDAYDLSFCDDVLERYRGGEIGLDEALETARERRRNRKQAGTGSGSGADAGAAGGSRTDDNYPPPYVDAQPVDNVVVADVPPENPPRLPSAEPVVAIVSVRTGEPVEDINPTMFTALDLKNQPHLVRAVVMMAETPGDDIAGDD